MDILLNTNLAYLLLVCGTFLAILAIFAPGTGILEIGALFVLLLAGWSIYNLPINAWALILLLVGVVPFLLAVRKSKKLLYLIIAILAFVIGSSFLFRGTSWWIPAVHPLLALVVSLLVGSYLWVAIRKVLDAESRPPTHDLEGLVGKLGEAKTDIHEEGSVQVAGELWTAYSDQLISAGTQVRVVARSGFILKVEKVHQVYKEGE